MLLSWLVALCLTLLLLLAAVSEPVFFLVMTQRPPLRKKKHDEALEAYQAAYAKHQEERLKLLDWIETQRESKELVKQNVKNTDL